MLKSITCLLINLREDSIKQGHFQLSVPIIVFSQYLISLMSKPVVFDDLCKKAKGTTMYHSQSFVDVLNDDYFLGTKMTMKVKNVKGIVGKENMEMI